MSKKKKEQIDWGTVPYCQCDEPEKYRLSDGDIVFARIGATTGKSYLVHNPPESIFTSYFIRIRLCDRVLPEYIWWYFQSSSYWAAVYSGIDDGNRPNMNGTKLGALKIPFPKSKEKQKQIVSRLEMLGEKNRRTARIAERDSFGNGTVPARPARQGLLGKVVMFKFSQEPFSGRKVSHGL